MFRISDLRFLSQLSPHEIGCTTLSSRYMQGVVLTASRASIYQDLDLVSFFSCWDCFYAIDPMVSRAEEHQATVQIRFEDLIQRDADAPSGVQSVSFFGRRVEVVDVDASGAKSVLLKPVDLDAAHVRRSRFSDSTRGRMIMAPAGSGSLSSKLAILPGCRDRWRTSCLSSMAIVSVDCDALWPPVPRKISLKLSHEKWGNVAGHPGSPGLFCPDEVFRARPLCCHDVLFLETAGETAGLPGIVPLPRDRALYRSTELAAGHQGSQSSSGLVVRRQTRESKQRPPHGRPLALPTGFFLRCLRTRR